MYIKPMIKSLTTTDVTEDIGPVQTAYAQVMWVQTDIFQPDNQQVHTNQFADTGIVRLEKKAQ